MVFKISSLKLQRMCLRTLLRWININTLYHLLCCPLEQVKRHFKCDTFRGKFKSQISVNTKF